MTTTNKTTDLTDQDAIRLLRRYDQLTAELRKVEQDLNKAAMDYGRRRGYTMLRVSSLRQMLSMHKAA